MDYHLKKAIITIRNVPSLLKRYVKYEVFKRPRPRWAQHFSVAVVKSDSISNTRTLAISKDSIDPLSLNIPNIEFLADPFLIQRDIEWFLFVEGFNRRKWKGEIGVFRSPDLMHWSDYAVALSEPYHLSYPFVFTSDSNYFMIPESIQAEGVHIYGSASFPFGWKQKACIIEGAYSDSSLIEHEGVWYCFCHSDSLQETHLYLSRSLFGPWKMHPKGTRYHGDTVRSRPAGRPFYYQGQLLRPVQKTKPVYGESVALLAIDILSESDWVETDYYEEPILGPSDCNWASGGMHHIDAQISSDGSIIAAVDGWRQI